VTVRQRVMGRIPECDHRPRTQAAANYWMVSFRRPDRMADRVGGQARRRNAPDLPGEHSASTSLGARIRGVAPVTLFTKRLPTIREPPSRALLVAQFESSRRLRSLRPQVSAPRVIGAALPVVANLFRMVVKRDSDSRRHRPHEKRLTIGRGRSRTIWVTLLFAAMLVSITDRIASCRSRWRAVVKLVSDDHQQRRTQVSSGVRAGW
jgi:hypothetical protein